MNRIQQLFQNKKGSILSIFYTAGFPNREDTILIAQQLEKSGVDMIEIGIPYSDPIADGPTIQLSNKRALENGMNLSLLIEQVRKIRKSVRVPIVLMGYLNPIMQYGIERFVKDSAEAGIDGVIIPDMPMDEYRTEYQKSFAANHLVTTFLVSPTTSEERIRKIDEMTNGFIYAVSASSTTGARGNFNQHQLEYFKKLKNLNLKNPFLIGFGISNRETFLEAVKHGAGVIIGSAFIDLLKGSTNLTGDIQEFVKSIRTQVTDDF